MVACGGQTARQPQAQSPAVGIASSEPETDDDCGARFFARLRELRMTAARLVLYRRNPLLRHRLRCALAHAAGVDVSLVLVDRARYVQDLDDVRSFAAWSAGVARAFPEIRRFVVWNEPNVAHLWNGGPTLYARLLTDTAAALHRVDGEIRVSGFGLNPTHAPIAFLRSALAAGARMDELSVHPYPASTAAPAAAAYRLVRRVERVWPGPLSLDEVGWQVTSRGRSYTGRENVVTTTEELQAERYVSFLRLAARDRRVRSVLLYRLVDETERRLWQSGLVRADGTPRPSFAAVLRYLAACLPVEGLPLVARVLCVS